MSEIVKIEHEGYLTEVELKPCGKCKVVPTAEDAQKAVAHERRTVKSCAVCGKKPEMYPRHSLYHSVDCDGKNSYLLCGPSFHDPTWSADWVTANCYGPAGRLDAAFHVSCLKRVAPGIVIHPH